MPQFGQSQLDLQQVQADEIKAKVQGGYLWLAMTIMVPTRLWLGGVISPRRDLALIQALADRIRALALCRPLVGYRQSETLLQFLIAPSLAG